MQLNHEVALIDVGKLSDAPLNTLWLYLILGIIFGIFGPIFNKWVLGMQDLCAVCTAAILPNGY